MKTTPLKIGKRTFALAFTANALAELEETVADFDIANIAETTKSMKTLLDVVASLARAGEDLEGRTLDVDRKWFGAHISPAPLSIAKVQIAVLNAYAEGMKMEAESDDEDGEVDVVLQELKKIRPPDLAPADGLRADRRSALP